MDIFDTPTGNRALQRFKAEQVIWLTTVTASGKPQPRPVWFVWDGQSVWIYTEHASCKIAHLAANPHASLHFNSDPAGDDIQVLLGDAVIVPTAPPVRDFPAYIEKYAEGIQGIDMTVESYSARFDTALRVTIERIRGLDPLV